MVNAYDAFLRSLEKPVILWLLSRKPRHGYELILEFKKLTGRKLKPSIVYPFLHKLEVEGFAVSKWIGKGKRKIKCYSLTSNGENLLKRTREIFSKPLKEILTGLVEKRENPS
ncbi:MAG: PadR family transcriptional regulator [Candidatus Bathyarchaeia archaeon]